MSRCPICYVGGKTSKVFSINYFEDIGIANYECSYSHTWQERFDCVVTINDGLKREELDEII